MNRQNIKGVAASPLRTRDSPAEPQRIVSLGDVSTLLTLGFLWCVSLVVPSRFWPDFAGACAHIHSRLRKPDLRAAARSLRAAGIAISDETLARDLLSGTYLENLEAVAGYTSRPLNECVKVRGLVHVEEGLQRGCGVLLWSSPFCGNAILTQRAFRLYGLSVIELRSHVHPFSATVAGRTFLNPIRTRIEDRYLQGSIELYPDRPREAMLNMDEALRRNQIVKVTANGSGKSPIEAPLMGGTLRIARGVPSLAKATGAAVIPVAVSILPGRRYVVEFEAPLDVDAALPKPQFESDLVQAYARHLENRLRVCPRHWRGWLMAHTWRP